VIELEVVIPCFNESGNLPRLLKEIEDVRCSKSVAFVLVNNGSSDETASILAQANQRHLRVVNLESNQGYGGGILAGLSTCTAPLVGWMHADLQTSPRVIEDLDLKNTSQCLVKGRREGRDVVDRVFTAGMSLLETVIFCQRMSDINGQPTVFPRVWFESLKSPPRDFSLDLFVYLHALRTGIQIVRVPVIFGSRFAGVSSWNTGMRSRLKFIIRTLQYSFELMRRDRENL